MSSRPRMRAIAAAPSIRLVLCLVAAATAAVPAAVPAAAQEPPASAPQSHVQMPPAQVLERQRARLDSLSPLLRDLGEKLRLEDSLRLVAAAEAWKSTALDTLRLGPLRLIGMPDVIARRRDLLEDVWSAHRHLYAGFDSTGTGMAILLTEELPAQLQESMQSRFDHQLRLAGLPRHRHRRVAQAAITAPAVDGMPQQVRQWLESQVIPSDVSAEDLYRRLVLMGSFRADECLAGQMQACAEVLGLHGGDPADLYRPAELARILARQSPRAARDAQLDVCGRGDLIACEAVMERVGVGATFAPSPIRAHFLTHVVNATPGTLGRLQHHAAGTTGERIAEAAGAPLDTLLAEWHASSLTDAPDPDRDGGRTRLAAAFWIAIFATFAGRSTRWRIG